MTDNDGGFGNRVVAYAYFAFCAAVLGWALYWSGTLAGYQEGRGIEASARHEAESKHQVEQACVALTGASLVECVYDTAAATQEAKRNEQNLDIQYGMEHWAFLMFVTAVLQTLVSGAALFFLMKDLRQNRISSEQQLRAYIDFGEVRFINLEFDPDGPKRGDNARYNSGALLEIRNFGSTPANNVSVHCKVEVIEKGVGVRWEGLFGCDLFTIAPTDSAPARLPFPIEEGVRGQVVQKRWMYRFIPVVHYTDTFGRKHGLEASYVSDGTANPFVFEVGSKRAL